MHKQSATNHLRSAAIRLLAFFCLMLCASFQLAAQTDTARIQGQVNDTTGAAIPGATITVINTSTNATTTVTSDNSGAFTANALPIGPYTPASTQQVSRGQIQTFTLSVSQVQALNFKLVPGAKDHRR